MFEDSVTYKDDSPSMYAAFLRRALDLAPDVTLNPEPELPTATDTETYPE
jgi:hypothetical protein